MPRILSLETSTTVCSAALHEDGRLLTVSEIHQDYSHGSRLAVLIDQLLVQTNSQPASLDAIAVTSGPGSYTGLRIGTSTAKGLAFTLNIPLIAVGTLDVMAWSVSQRIEFEGLFCPMLDARRMEVYCKVYSPDLHHVVSELAAMVIDENSFSELLGDSRILFFGPGAGKCRTIVTHSNASFMKQIYPTAGAMGELAFKKFEAKEFEDIVHFEPLYLKDFVAKKSEKSRL